MLRLRDQALAVTLATMVAIPASSAEMEAGSLWGTASAAAGPNAPAAALGTIAAANRFTNASYGTGGTGLRNRLVGGIEVSAVGQPVKAAFLYWAIITNGAAPQAARTPSIARRSPSTSGAVNLAGTVVGTGTSPCWPQGNTITVFKATVPISVASGAGLYEVRFPSGASGSSAGGDPFFGTQVAPLLEGASLVIVGQGAANVAVYDSGLSGATFVASSGLSYSLSLPAAFSGSVLHLDNIGADGQHGAGRLAVATTSNETTTVNGRAVAGGASAYRDSDWNGTVAGPLPELWDTTSHDITALVSRGTTSLSVSISGGSDCLTPVANVVRVR